MESESNRKQWALQVGKTAMAFIAKHGFWIMMMVLMIAMMPIFASSLKEVQELVDAEVVPKPLFEFIISSVGLCVIMFCLQFKRR